MKQLLAIFGTLFLAACAAKPVVHVPAEKIDIALHCGKGHQDDDGCIVEDHDTIKVYVLTRKAMCEKE